MALEDQFESFTDRLDGFFGSFMGQQQAAQENLTSRLENAVSQGFGSVQDAVSEVDGGIEPNPRPSGIEEQVESINATITSGLGDAIDAIGEVSNEDSSEDLIGNVISNLEGELSLAGIDAINQDLSRVEEVFSTLSNSAEVSEEQLQGFASVFEQFGEQVNEVEDQLSEGQVSVQEAQQQVQELAGQVQEEFEDITGDRFENFDQSVQDLVDLSQQFATNIQEAADIAQDAQGAAFGQDALAVGGAVSEIGGGGLSFFQTLQTRAADIASVLTEGTENLQPLGSAIGNLQEINTGDLEEVNTISGAISTRTNTILSNISATRVALAGILAPLAIAADLLEDTFNVARDFRKETGIGAERMRELREVTADVSTELAGFGLEPAAVGDVALSLVDRFGSIETATAQSGENLETLISQSGRLAGALGVSAERGAEITGTFVELENLIGGSAERGAALTNELAQAREVAPQEAFEQITSNAEQLSQFSGNTTESLAEAAVQAQQLGTSLGTVADFQEQALGDITGQIQQLQEAQMLTGQQLDATALISASYQGTEETLTEITDQLEGLDFENLDFFQRQALQEAFPGFSLSELERLSRGREILEETNTTLQRAQAIAAGDLTFEQAVRADDVDEVERLRRQFNQLYFVIAENLFPIVSDLLGILTQLTPAIELLSPVVEGFATGVRLLVSPIQLLETSIVALEDLFYDTEESAEALDASIKSLGDTFRGLLSPIRDLTGFDFFGLFEERSKEAKESVSSFTSVLESAGILLGTYETVSFFTGLPSALGGLSTLIGKIPVVNQLFSGLGTVVGKLTPNFLKFGSATSTAASTLDDATDTISTGSKTMGKMGTTVSSTAGKVSKGSSSMIASFSKLAGVSAVILSLGGGVMMLAEAAQMFAEVDTNALLATGGALAGLTTAVIGTLTAISATGVGALAMGAAAGVIATFAGSMYVLAEATETAAPAVSSLTTSLMKLATIPAGAYYKVAAGITALGGALTALASGGIATGVASLFGGSVIDQLSQISGMATEIQIVASSVQTLAESMQSLQNVDISSAVSQLENLSDTGTLSATGEAAEAGEVGVQAEGPGVATVDQNIATGPQQAAAAAQQAATAQQTEGETQEVRLDSETDNVKGVLQEILNTQRQLLQDLRDGKIAVYLDGRKVNKELVRGLGLVE